MPGFLLLRFAIPEARPRGIGVCWCKLCDEPRIHDVRDIHTRTWIWGAVPLWSTRLLEETRCRACGLLWFSRDEPIPTEPDQGQSLEELAAATAPDLIEQDSELREIESELDSTDEPDGFRAMRIQRRMDLLAMMFDYARLGIAPDRLLFGAVVTLSIMFGIVVLGFSATFIATALQGRNSGGLQSSPLWSAVMAIWVVTFLACFLAIPIVLMIWLTRVDRFVRREGIPTVIRVLAPLRPSEAELVEPFATLKLERRYMAKVLKPRKIVTLIERHLAQESMRNPQDSASL